LRRSGSWNFLEKNKNLLFVDWSVFVFFCSKKPCASVFSWKQLLGVLKKVQDPDLRKEPLCRSDSIRNLKIDKGLVAFDLNLTTPACPVKDQMRDEAVSLVKALPGVHNVEIKMTSEVRQTPQLDKGALKGRSEHCRRRQWKGGVGKSTIAVNIAAALAACGRARRSAGRRYLRSDDSDHAGFGSPAEVRWQSYDPAGVRGPEIYVHGSAREIRSSP